VNAKLETDRSISIDQITIFNDAHVSEKNKKVIVHKRINSQIFFIFDWRDFPRCSGYPDRSSNQQLEPEENQ